MDAQTDSDTVPASIPLPEAHTWDTAAFLVISILQYTRTLLPLAVLCGGASFVITTCLLVKRGTRGALEILFTALFLVPLLVLHVICDRIDMRKDLFGNSDSYVGLLTHITHLPGALRALPEEGQLSTYKKAIFVLAMMSWQELLGCLAVAAWAVAAFTPEFFTRNSPWPCWDMISWIMMQLDFLVRGKQLWPAVVGFGAVLSAFVVGGFALKEWGSRRSWLLLLAAVRRGGVPESLQVADGDSLETREGKAEQLRAIETGLMKPATIWERWAIPQLLLTEVMFLIGLLYGTLLALPRNTLPAQQLHYNDPLPSANTTSDAGEPHGSGWTSLLTAVAWSWPALKAPLQDWRVGVLVLGIFWVLAALRTWQQKKAWEHCYNARRRELLDEDAGDEMSLPLVNDAAKAKTVEALGPYPPSTLVRLRTWAIIVFDVLLGMFWAGVLIGWICCPGYLPAYAIPAYGAGTSGRGPAVQWVRDVGRGPRLYTTDSRLGGWWAELHTAARVNLLAVRAWRKGGLDGVQGAMEALRAAVHSSQMVAGPGPEPKEVHKHAVLTLLQLQAWGPSGTKWELGGKWSLGLNWERRQVFGKAEGHLQGADEKMQGLDTDSFDNGYEDAFGGQQCALDPVADIHMLWGRVGSAAERCRRGEFSLLTGDGSPVASSRLGTTRRAKRGKDGHISNDVPSGKPADVKTRATTTTPTVKAGPSWSSSLGSTLVHLAVAGGLVLGLVLAGALLVVSMRSARAAVKKKTKNNVAPARKKQADADKAGKKGKQQQQAATAAASQKSVPGRQQHQQTEKLPGPESSAPSASSSTGSAAAAHSPAAAPAKAAASPTSATSSTAAASAVSATTAATAKAPPKASATAKQAAPVELPAKQQKQQQKHGNASSLAGTSAATAVSATRDIAKAAAANSARRERPASPAGSDDVAAAADKGVPAVVRAAASAPSGPKAETTKVHTAMPRREPAQSSLSGLSAAAAAVAAVLPFASTLATTASAEPPPPPPPAEQRPVVVASASSAGPASDSSVAPAAAPSPLASAGIRVLRQATPSIHSASTLAKSVAATTGPTAAPPLRQAAAPPAAPFREIPFPPIAAPAASKLAPSPQPDVPADDDIPVPIPVPIRSSLTYFSATAVPQPRQASAPAATAFQPALQPDVPADDDIPVPIPVPIRSSLTSIPATATAAPQPPPSRPAPPSPSAAPSSAAPVVAAPTVGLNPALAHFLRRAAPAPITGAGATAPTV